MGIEPTSEAWEASILPLYDARSLTILGQTFRESSSYSCRYTATPRSEKTPSKYRCTFLFLSSVVLK
jgi:hypothetical protein